MAKAPSRAAVAKKGVIHTMLMAALWLIKEGIDGSKLASLLDLSCVSSTLQCARKYNHCRYFWGDMYACSKVLLVSTVKVAASSHYALLFDGDTDINTQNYIMVYVRFLDMTSHAIVTEFLCCVSVRADDATHHYEVLIGIRNSLGLSKKR
jgi:hypothetical protein